MDFASESFSVVLDKGKLDSILNEGSGQVSEHQNQTLDEVQRILRTGGRYLCLTLAPQQILNKLLNQFSSGWFVRIHKVELEKIPTESLVPLFVCVFTKTRFISSVASDTGAQIPKVLEMCLHGTDVIERVDSVDCIKSVIQECQAYFVIHKKLGKTVKTTDTLTFSCGIPVNIFNLIPQYFCLSGDYHPEERFTLDLWTAVGTKKEKQHPRYCLSVIDIPTTESKNGTFAIFIVPQGQFSTLGKTAEASRPKLSPSVLTHFLLLSLGETRCSSQLRLFIFAQHLCTYSDTMKPSRLSVCYCGWVSNSS